MAPEPTTPPPVQQGGEGRYWPDGTPKIWCELHQRDVGHTTAQCWKGSGGKGGGGTVANAAPLYPVAPATPPPYGRGPTWPTAAQTEEEQRRVAREVLAEAMPARAGELYRSNCPIGITVTFTRTVQAEDVSTLREAFRSIVRIYRSEGTIFAGFNTTEDRNAVLKRLEGACDHQGNLSTPLVVLPIDSAASPSAPASPTAARPIAFGNAPTVMEPIFPNIVGRCYL